MEMSSWKRGYEQIPDVRGMEKELGESRKHTSPLWKYLAIGAIPILVCGVLALAVFAGVLSLGLVILHDRCPPAEIPVARTYVVDLDLAAHNWTSRAAAVTSLNSYLQTVAANKTLVYANAYNPLLVRFAHTSKELYTRIFNEVYYDTPDNVRTHTLPAAPSPSPIAMTACTRPDACACRVVSCDCGAGDCGDGRIAAGSFVHLVIGQWPRDGRQVDGGVHLPQRRPGRRHRIGHRSFGQPSRPGKGATRAP